jgi:hypothetical protein
MLKNLINFCGEKIHWFLTDGGWRIILLFAFIAIVFAMVGYYSTQGFNLGRFLRLELPLYLFCGWALSKVFKLIKDNPDIFR